MKIFFDCEFTSLESPKLISAGFASEEGREFYAELSDTWREAECSLFVIDTVLPLLSGSEARMTSREFVSQLGAWIEELGQPAELVCDSDFDWPLIASLLERHGWPQNLSKSPGRISFRTDAQRRRYEEEFNRQQHEHLLTEHHALTDARCIRQAWSFATRKGPRG